MPITIPARVRWAVDVLSVDADDRVLEIGCGRGTAVHAIAEQLRGGHITAIDRSATAIAGARANNSAAVRARKVRFLTVPLADVAIRGPFDKAFAINVNVFWLGPTKELAVLRRVLTPRGRLYLFYEPPSASVGNRAATACAAFLNDAGWTVTQVLRTDLPPHVGVCLVATPSA